MVTSGFWTLEMAKFATATIWKIAIADRFFCHNKKIPFRFHSVLLQSNFMSNFSSSNFWHFWFAWFIWFDASSIRIFILFTTLSDFWFFCSNPSLFCSNFKLSCSSSILFCSNSRHFCSNSRLFCSNSRLFCSSWLFVIFPSRPFGSSEKKSLIICLISQPSRHCEQLLFWANHLEMQAVWNTWPLKFVQDLNFRLGIQIITVLFSNLVTWLNLLLMGHVTRLLGCTDPKVCTIDLFISPKTSANNLSKFLENKVGMCFKKQNYLFWLLVEVGGCPAWNSNIELTIGLKIYHILG